MSLQVQAKNYPYDHLPAVDYAQHPAYGRAFQSRLQDRFAALRKFAAGFSLIAARRLTDYEHLPRPKDKARKVSSLLRNAPTYLRLIASQRFRRLGAGKAFEPKMKNGKEVLDTLERDGIVGIRLTPQQLENIRKALDPHFKILEDRLSRKTPEDRHFDETRLWLDAKHHPAIYKLFNEIADQLGVIEAASAYLNRPVSITHVVPQINDPTDNFWSNHFDDVEADDSPCDYCHIDATYNLLKFIIYVSDVGQDNGPFSYVPGSHRANRGFWDGMIRRANDYAGLSWTKPRSRELFNALPAFLQRKAAFGVDIAKDNPYAAAILDNEWQVTSNQGDGVLFDPFGIHRGGMVRKGRRLVVTMMLTEG